MTDKPQPSINTLGITSGKTVRLIGATPEIHDALAPFTEGATVTTLASESADVGIIVVQDDADLRERLFTELEGLMGATHVWILTQSDTGPDLATIKAAADLVSWRSGAPESLGLDLTAVRLSRS
ncbi:hypothetical protein GCM10025867_08970 [Frondihabitans sucicola]|uniref:Uncharacterized protein n=1 Tax=Frondihabitans sucicola TaxID=1268041 RepID=A0ABM8GJU9_9MICO|nr:hypothetical protein [Frondihabitans sucicola]BDZ48656.1 hypothetical protein GCM10025867_08970 [Frondihabitans sucicola]